MEFDIQLLQKSHQRAEFDCGNPTLNSYIQRFARQNQDKDIGRTYVAVERGQWRVWGYYTLSAASIEFAEYPDNAGLPQYPIPAILLARLAADKQFHGKGLGPDLLVHALKTAQVHADGIAAAAVITEAIDEHAQQFYAKYGFRPFKKEGRHLYMTMKAIREIP